MYKTSIEDIDAGDTFAEIADLPFEYEAVDLITPEGVTTLHCYFVRSIKFSGRIFPVEITNPRSGFQAYFTVPLGAEVLVKD